MSESTFLNERVVISVGDIAEQNVGAVVNAANWTLLGGGGVDGAIHRAGGPEILHECQRIRETEYPNGLPTGKAVITTGGNLPARYVIHTVGPIYGQNSGKDAERLADSYRNSLELAAENDISTIAFPSISTGAFHYPKHEAAKIASAAIGKFLETDDRIIEVRLVFFAPADAAVFIKHQIF